MAIDTNAALLRAEQAGLKLAIKGRLAAALILAVFYGLVGQSSAIFVGLVTTSVK